MTEVAKLATVAYAEYWGKRRLVSRQLEHEPAKPRSGARKRSLKIQQLGKTLATLKGRKQEHARAVQAAILARDSGKAEGILGPLPVTSARGEADSTKRQEEDDKRVSDVQEIKNRWER